MNKDQLLSSLKDQMQASLDKASTEISAFYKDLMDKVSSLDIGASQADLDAANKQIASMKDAEAKVVAAVAEDMKPIS